MVGVVLIEGKELDWIKDQITSLQKQNDVLVQLVQKLLPVAQQSSVPDFISIKDACKKYKISHTTVNNKIKAFKEVNGRDIDRIQSGTYFLINEVELQHALRLKSTTFKHIHKIAQKKSA